MFKKISEKRAEKRRAFKIYFIFFKIQTRKKQLINAFIMPFQGETYAIKLFSEISFKQPRKRFAVAGFVASHFVNGIVNSVKP